MLFNMTDAEATQWAAPVADALRKAGHDIPQIQTEAGSVDALSARVAELERKLAEAEDKS